MNAPEISPAIVAAIAAVVSAAVGSVTSLLTARRAGRRSDLGMKMEYLEKKLAALKEIREAFIQAAIREEPKPEPDKQANQVADSVASTVASTIIALYGGAAVALTLMEDWVDETEIQPIRRKVHLAEASLRYHRAQANNSEWQEDPAMIVSKEDLIDLLSDVGSETRALLQKKIAATRLQMEELVS